MASWLTSRLKAAEQFLNQIDATAAERAQKAKDKDLTSDTDSRFGNHFSRTGSELSLTDENRASGHSADESSEAGQRQRVRALNQTGFTVTAKRKEPGTSKQGAPATVDWTELLRGTEKDRPGDSSKLFRTASNVNAPLRTSRIYKVERALAPPQPKQETVIKGETELPAESSTGSVADTPGKHEDEALSSRTSILEGQVAVVSESGELTQSKSLGAKAGPIHIETDTATDLQRGEPMPGADLEVKASMPTSDSKEETASAETAEADEGKNEPAPILERPEESAEPGPGGKTEIPSQRPALLTKEATESESVQDESRPETDSKEAAQGGDAVPNGKTAASNYDRPSTLRAQIEAGRNEQTSLEKEEPPQASSKTTEKGLSAKDFSLREYMGRDLSVKDVETEGVDSDADASESGTDDESDSNSDDSEDERAEKQKQKEEEERQALERQRATAAAAALELSAAETAARAVKEREEVIALLEKEREELQIDAAEASERHAKEIARLRASATAGSKAAHVEKSSHSSTRMQTYSKEEQLVMENVEKAKALAAAQRALEEVVTQALEERRKVDDRELHRAGLQKRLEETQQRLHQLQEGSKQDEDRPSQSESPLTAKLERGAAEIERKKLRVVELEERLTAAASQRREPSEQEKELERRLQSLTDHLIQKQAQVEALASEKATLALRLETVTSSLQEEAKGEGPFRKRGKQAGRHSVMEWWLEDDLEYGSAETSNRAQEHGRRNSFNSDDEDDEHAKKRRGNILPGFLVTAIQQFDNLTVGGGRFLRVNTPARVLLALYLLMLHAWVLLVWSVHSSGSMGEGVHELATSLPGNKDSLASPTETLAAVRRLSPLFADMDT